MAGSQVYSRKVVNKSGEVFLFPRVARMDELLDGTTAFNPYAQAVAQAFPLGTLVLEGDERGWVYCKNGAGTLTPGMTLQSPAIVNAAESGDIVVDAASVAGSYEVSLTSQAVLACAADFYKEGYLIINDAAGEGHCYKIKSNQALVGTTAGSIFTLYDPIKTALTASSEVGLAKNKHDMVVASEAPLTRAFVGVAPIDVTAAYYFWAGFSGYHACYVHATIALGKGVCVGVTAGQVDPTGTIADVVIIGTAVTDGVATENCIVDIWKH